MKKFKVYCEAAIIKQIVIKAKSKEDAMNKVETNYGRYKNCVSVVAQSVEEIKDETKSNRPNSPEI